MLSKPQRMVNAEDFARTIRQGRKAGSSTIVVHSLPTESSRVGFVVSKAVGNAVVRNRVRRVLRHLMRDRVSEASWLGDTSVVVRVMPAAAAASREELQADLDRCLDRVSA